MKIGDIVVRKSYDKDIIFKIIDMVKSIKVSEEIQARGLDKEFFNEKYETKHE